MYIQIHTYVYMKYTQKSVYVFIHKKLYTTYILIIRFHRNSFNEN